MDEVSLAKGLLLRLPVWEASAVGRVARVSILLGFSLREVFYLLGRSPAKNCKNDLDDQT